MSQTRVILASSSPRRAELLDQIGVSYRVHAVDVDFFKEIADRIQAISGDFKQGSNSWP